MSGIGKTEIAIEYANRFQEEYDFISWFNAEDIQILKSQILALASNLGVNTDIKLGDEKTKLKTILNSINMELRKFDNTLFVFDNAENYNQIKDYLPSEGHVLITSIDRNWSITKFVVDMEVFKREESIEFILNSTNESDKDVANELAEELADYPLVLEQATSYIKNDLTINIKSYLKMFCRYKVDEVKQNKYFFEDIGVPTFYNKNLATAWILTFEKVQEICSAAIDISYLCAFFSPDNIILDMFISNKNILLNSFTSLNDYAEDFEDVFKHRVIFGVMYRYSIVGWDSNSHSLKMHRIIQLIIRAILKKQNKNSIYEKVVSEILTNTFVFNKNDSITWKKCEILLPHVIFFARYVNSVNNALFTPKILELYIMLGKYYNNLRLVSEAKEFLNLGLSIIQKMNLGINTQYEAGILCELGYAYYNESKLPRAKKLFYKANDIANSVYGSNSPETVYFLIGTGVVMLALERPDIARDVYEKALKIDLEFYGDANEYVSRDLNHLAGTLINLGKPQIAKEYYERVLEIDKTIYKGEHQNIARDLSNIGNVLFILEKYNEAISYYQKALKIEERIYSKSHSKIALCFEGLGNALVGLKDFKEATEYYHKALDINKKIFGNRSRDTARVMTSIGIAKVKLGKYEEGIKIYIQGLEVMKVIYGSDSIHFNSGYLSLMLLYNEIPSKYRGDIGDLVNQVKYD